MFVNHIHPMMWFFEYGIKDNFVRKENWLIYINMQENNKMVIESEIAILFIIK